MANYDQLVNLIGNQAYNSYEILDYIDDDIRLYYSDFTLDKHKKCKPPDEAYLFFPKEEELYEIHEINESRISRKIFGVKNFTEFETDNLIKFETYIANFNELNVNRQLTFTDDWERWDTLKFLESCNYDYKKTLQLISDYLDWRYAYFPIELRDKSIEILSFSGFIYCHGRDNNFRPNVFIKAEIYFNNLNNYSYEDWEMALVFFCEYLIDNMLIPGQIEQWNLFVDLDNINILNLSEDIEKLIKLFRDYYVSRVNYIYVFGMKEKFEGLYKMVLTMLEPLRKYKIMFINERNQEEIFRKCNKEQIEQKYGGIAKNIYCDVSELEKNLDLIKNSLSNSSMDISNSSDSVSINFFPPFMPSNKYKKFEAKRFSRSMEKPNSLVNINYKNTLSPHFNTGTANIFSTPKANLSRNNVFVYNPKSYNCIQMSELASTNVERKGNNNNTVEINNNALGTLFNDPKNNNKNNNKTKNSSKKLVPKPLDLKDISESKLSNLEKRSQSHNINNSQSILNKFSRVEREGNINKIIEKGIN